MKVKVCGITGKEDLQAMNLFERKVDFVGFILFPDSKRYVGEKLQELSQTVICANTSRVGVFVNADLEEVRTTCGEYGIDYAQLHGSESPEYCSSLSKSVRVIKAFNVDDSFQFESLNAYEAYCEYFLFDAKGKLPGGNSISYDWNILQRYSLSTPFFLSGGIRPEHKAQLQIFSHPALFAIDINSGFETSPGKKDTKLIEEFVQQLNQPV